MELQQAFPPWRKHYVEVSNHPHRGRERRPYGRVWKEDRQQFLDSHVG